MPMTCPRWIAVICYSLALTLGGCKSVGSDSGLVKDVEAPESNTIFYSEDGHVFRKNCKGDQSPDRNCDSSLTRSIPEAIFFAKIGIESNTSNFDVLNRGLQRARDALAAETATANDASLTPDERYNARSRADALAPIVAIVERIDSFRQRIQAEEVVTMAASRLEIKWATAAMSGSESCTANCLLTTPFGAPGCSEGTSCYDVDNCTARAQKKESAAFSSASTEPGAMAAAAKSACETLKAQPYFKLPTHRGEKSCTWSLENFTCAAAGSDAPQPQPQPQPPSDYSCSKCYDTCAGQNGRPGYHYNISYRGKHFRESGCYETAGQCLLGKDNDKTCKR